MTLKVSAILASAAELDALKTVVADIKDVVFIPHVGGLPELKKVIASDASDVVILDLPTTQESDLEIIETLLQEDHELHMMLVSPDRSVEFLLRAMRAGVRQVLPAPLDIASVKQALVHVSGRQRKLLSLDEDMGQVLALVGSKGGAGTTFLATNLAYALSRQGKRVAVLDLNFYFGDAGIFLGDSKSVSNTVELARKAEQLDPVLLEASMVKVSDRLHILMAPDSPEHVKYVMPADVEKIIRMARSCYEFVVIDVPGNLDPLAVKALDSADLIYLVLQLNFPFVRAAKRIVDEFRELGYPNDKLRVIINRMERGDVKPEDVEKATLIKAIRTIPNSHLAVTESINQGVPILELNPRNPVSTALQEWAQELAPHSHPVAPTKHPSWWQSLRHKKAAA
jgi:pilus assembly protein CpaE